MSVNDPESTGSIDFGVTSAFEPIDEFAKVESANNEDLLQIDGDFLQNTIMFG